MNQNATVSLNAQLVLTQQVAHLAEDGPFEQEEQYPQLAPTKMPDLKPFSDANAAKIYASRLCAYDIISKTMEHFKAEHISEAHQTTFLNALRRDLGPFLTMFGGTATAKSAPSSQAQNLTALNTYLYVPTLSNSKNTSRRSLFAKDFLEDRRLLVFDFNPHFSLDWRMVGPKRPFKHLHT